MDYQVSEIINSIKQPQFFKDKILTNAVPIVNKDRLLMYAGGYGQIFQLKQGDNLWAVKVWHTEIENNSHRYKLIKNYLQQKSMPWFLDYEYSEKGLWLPKKNEYIDTLRMKWVDGLNISEYISLNLNNKEALKKLSSDFLSMIKSLRDNNISHGDLQHANIIIDKTDGSIKLIDYDSICIPELEGELEYIRGHIAFQHPWRFSLHQSPSSVNADVFSELIIFLTIKAITENKLLWDKYNCFNAERFLFTCRDFMEFNTSEIRKDLNNLSGEIKTLVKILESYISFHYNTNPFYES